MLISLSGPSKGPDVESSPRKSSTSISVVWKELSLDDANGVITEYRVCYMLEERSTGELCNSNVSANQNLNVTLSGLQKYKSYVIGVRASTAIGFGPPGKTMTIRTNQDCK